MEGLGERYQILSYKLYNPRDLICHVHPLDNLNFWEMRPKCRVVYEMVLHCTRKEIFGLWRRSSLIALRETAERFGPSITESDNKHTRLLPGPMDSTANQRRRERIAKFRIQVELRKTLRTRLAFSLLDRPPLAETFACHSTQVFVLKNLP